MRDPLYIGECPVCHHGRQFVRKVRETSEFFLRCEECESEWQTPDTASDPSKTMFRKFSNDTLATREDMEDHPWANRVQNLKEI